MSVPRAIGAPESVGATARASPADRSKDISGAFGFPRQEERGRSDIFVPRRRMDVRNNILKIEKMINIRYL